MPNLVKATTDALTADLLRSLVSKLVHVTVNEHAIQDGLNGGTDIQNVWFAGRVAGFEVAEIHYDWENEMFFAEPQIHRNMLLTDGSGWVLSSTKLEINEITEDEFQDLVAQQVAANAVHDAVNNSSMLVPEKTILVPGKDF